MDQPKIERLLRLMQMMSGSVDYSIDELAEKLGISYRSVYRYIDTFKSAGFVVGKLSGNVYKLCKMPRTSLDISKLVFFSEEEAYIVNGLINSIDESNTLKADLHRKLAAVYQSTTIAEYVGDKSSAANVETLGEAIKAKKKVWLREYESARSHTVRDRLVEPFDFSGNFVDVWAYDLEHGENRTFKISRIHWVDTTEEGWTEEENHRKGLLDCFRMQGFNQIHVRLELNVRAKNLLLEEYPMARADIKPMQDKWLLDTMVSDLAGVGRFVTGLAQDIRIIDSPELSDYVRDYMINALKGLS